MLLRFSFHHWHSLLLVQASNHLQYMVGITAQLSILDVAIHGDNLSCFLIHFLHLLFRQFNNASTIQTGGTIHVFIAWNMCFTINFGFHIALNFLKYSFLMFSYLFSTSISFLQNVKVLIPFFTKLTNLFNIFQLYSIVFKLPSFFHIQNTTLTYIKPGADLEILKRGGALCRPPWIAAEGNLRFQMV